MSGSSLDGVDLALCRFKVEGDQILEWTISAAETFPFSSNWTDRLSNSRSFSGQILIQTDMEFGAYLGELAFQFLEKYDTKADFLVSHGHTVYHNPPHYTFQMGHGSTMSAKAGLPVIVDLRAMDLAQGGEGAPIAPLVDEYLFSEYNVCLNLGGIANLSGLLGDNRIAFDILPCNQVLNFLAGQEGMAFDRDGALASTGKLDEGLLDKLDNWPFLRQPIPRSLSNEYISASILPLIEKCGSPVKDKLHTVSHWISKHIVQCVMEFASQASPDNDITVLCTGGGVWNRHLMSELYALGVLEGEIIKWEVPEPIIIDFKEALLTALFGLFRYLALPNTRPSWTGAKLPTVGGAIYWNKP